MPFRCYDAPPAFCGGGGGLISTADDYLKFARMLLNNGELDGVRLSEARDRRADVHQPAHAAQRAIPFLGHSDVGGQGFGLGVSVITDAEKQAWMGMGANGAFGWPGAFGTWWQADPRERHDHDLPDPELDAARARRDRDISPRASAWARALALPIFQRLVYDALA